jgi:hypothetical protein
MSLIVLWLVLAVIVGVGANTRGRSGPGWFLLAVVISPLLAGLLVLVLPRGDRAASYREVSTTRTGPDGVTVTTREVTPLVAEPTQEYDDRRTWYVAAAVALLLAVLWLANHWG